MPRKAGKVPSYCLHKATGQAVVRIQGRDHYLGAYGSKESHERDEGKRLLHHSDRGCQYTSDAYQQTLRMLGISCSMSRTGCCYDNAVMERFFWSLKHEWTNHDNFQNLADARLSVFRYIETFYNPERLHQTLDYLSPNQFEAEHAPASAA